MSKWLTSTHINSSSTTPISAASLSTIYYPVSHAWSNENDKLTTSYLDPKKPLEVLVGAVS